MIRSRPIEPVNYFNLPQNQSAFLFEETDIDSDEELSRLGEGEAPVFDFDVVPMPMAYIKTEEDVDQSDMAFEMEVDNNLSISAVPKVNKIYHVLNSLLILNR